MYRTDREGIPTTSFLSNCKRKQKCKAKKKQNKEKNVQKRRNWRNEQHGSIDGEETIIDVFLSRKLFTKNIRDMIRTFLTGIVNVTLVDRAPSPHILFTLISFRPSFGYLFCFVIVSAVQLKAKVFDTSTLFFFIVSLYLAIPRLSLSLSLCFRPSLQRHSQQCSLTIFSSLSLSLSRYSLKSPAISRARFAIVIFKSRYTIE